MNPMALFRNRLGRPGRIDRRTVARRLRIESLEERRFLSGGGPAVGWINGESAGEESIEFPYWQNTLRPLDVNDNAVIAADDALQVINELNAHGARRISTSELLSSESHPFYDTNGDQYINPIDALRVINYLNAVMGDTTVDPPLEFAAPQMFVADSTDLQVDAYSAPVCADLNSDNLPDLLVGEKAADGQGKVRFYLNVGTATSPSFGDFSFIQAGGADLTVPASGCLGACPRLFDYNGDGWDDLLVGLADGTLRAYPNEKTFAGSVFGDYEILQVGYPEQKIPIDVGDRATVEAVDWDGDGREDLLVGGLDGRVRLYRNAASAGPADFRTEQILPAGQTDLIVSSGRSAVAAAELNGDGLVDLLLGNTDGELICYRNVGQPGTPRFREGEALQIDAVPIDLDGQPRSRPFVGDLNGDGRPDILLGSLDGKIRFYQGLPSSDSTGDTSDDDTSGGNPPNCGCG